VLFFLIFGLPHCYKALLDWIVILVNFLSGCLLSILVLKGQQRDIADEIGLILHSLFLAFIDIFRLVNNLLDDLLILADKLF
jgi:hypothetical protein